MAEMSRGAKIGLTAIQRDARRVHRWKRKSNNLARSVIVDFKSFANPGHGIYLDSGIAPYAAYVHEGTAPHVIKAVRKKVLAFVRGGKVMFRKQVNHPGTKPDPFLYEAADRGVNQLIREITRGISRAIVKIGLAK